LLVIRFVLQSYGTLSPRREKAADDFEKIMQVLKDELDNEGLRLDMVFADRDSGGVAKSTAP
jgi:hypothetical protein